MEYNSKSAFMPSITYGVLLGVILVIFTLITYVAGLEENKVMGFLPFVIAALYLYFIIVNFRDKQQNGFLSYGKGVSVGTLTGVFAGIVLAIFNYIYVTYIDTSILEQAMVKAEESILQSQPNISDEDLDRSMKMVEMFTQPAIMALMNIIWYTIVSLVFSLLISIFAKREDINIA